MKGRLVTQQNISRMLFYAVGVFIVLLILRVGMNFVPPLITSIEAQRISKEYVKVTVNGISFREQHPSSLLIIGERVVKSHDILEWKKRRIIVVLDYVENRDVGIVQVSAHEITSNVVAFQYPKEIQSSNPDDVATVDAKLEENVSAGTEDGLFVPRLNTVKLVYPEKGLSPGMSLELDRLSINARSFSIFSNSLKKLDIPLYLKEDTDTIQKIYLPEALWFDRKREYVLRVEELSETYDFPFSLRPIVDAVYNEYSMDIMLDYENQRGNQDGDGFVILPYSTTYQKSTVKKGKIVNSNINHIVYVSTSPHEMTMHIQQIVQEREVDSFTPVFYTSQKSFEPLFSFTNKEVKLVDIFNEKVGNISEIKLPGLRLSSLLKQNDINRYYGTDKNVPVSVEELARMNKLLYDYILLVKKNTSDIPIDVLKEKSIVLRELEDFSFRFDGASLRNYIMVEYLREQGIVARTVVGYDRELSATSRASWVEIFSQEQGWLILDGETFLLGKKSRVGLYVLEEIFEKTFNHQYYFLPEVKGLKLLE